MANLSSIIGFPLVAFLALMFFSKAWSKNLIRFVGVSGIALSFFATMAVCVSTSLPTQETLWNILPAGLLLDNAISFGLRMDSLSLTMALVVSFVSSMIAIYSAEYMAHEEGLGRFFAGVNLFVAFMLLLVLADSLWVLFVGWEGVGLASYLLIGFYHREPKAVAAAMKAFLTTRVGDIFLLFGIFFTVIVFGTLDIESIKAMSVATSIDETWIITVICLCFLGGACGKSAQLPLQTWLADAMWGPTPVSALIHAATMVTAGVYLLVRMSFLVALSPVAQMAIMAVGLITLIAAGIAALAQSDMKRVLAYSTMSQIGYMFLAVGALAFQAAVFHLVTHAFFKALLFLSAGIIGHALHSYDLKNMGGLRKSMPVVFWFFIIGSVSLMGLPLLGSGFFSKEWILNDVAIVPIYGEYLFCGAIFGTLLTAIYTVRMLALAFFGERKKPIEDHSGFAMYGSVSVLAIFSIFIGWLEAPHFLANIHIASDFLSSSVTRKEGHAHELLWLIPSAIALLGIAIALSQSKNSREALKQKMPSLLTLFARSGLGFDDLYTSLLVRPYQNLARVMQPDFIKAFYHYIVDGMQGLFTQIAVMHTGRLSHYLSFMMIALVALASLMVLS